ncbi:hypothetical protein D3C75_863290 [compost metagenome]
MNTVYTDLAASTIAHGGVSHVGNFYGMSAAQISAGVFPVTAGNHSKSFVSGSNWSNGNMYNNTALTSTMLVLTGGDFYVGQLYGGHTTLNDPARNPINGVEFVEGHKRVWAFGKQTTYVDAVTGAMGHSNVSTQVVIGSQLVHPETWYGPNNPQTNPVTYGSRAWAKGSMVINESPTMTGVVPDRTYVEKWICVQSSSITPGGPGVWVEIIGRSLV